MVIVIDNYDSFTFNIVQYLKDIGSQVNVYKNDQISVEEIETLNPTALIISPGPGTPNDSGISLEVLRKLSPGIPTLGICLGHQCIGQVFGATVSNAREVVHGKVSDVFHDRKGIFRNITEEFFKATRYHSLVIKANGLVSELEVSAWTKKSDGSFDEIMGVRHCHLPIEGVQFHPESVLSEHGHLLLQSFLSSYP